MHTASGPPLDALFRRILALVGGHQDLPADAHHPRALTFTESEQ
jgi:hypothetical protein